MGCGQSTPSDTPPPRRPENAAGYPHFVVDSSSDYVNEDGAGRPLRISVSDACSVRPRTGEESAFEMNDDGEIGDGRLGMSNEEEIRHILANLNGELFEDPDFPAASRSLFYSRRSQSELDAYSWKRPFELARDPHIYVDGTSRRDVIQVSVNSCSSWGSCTTLGQN